MSDSEKSKKITVNVVPGEKLLIKMWETVADKIVGTILSSWQTRRESRARTDAERERTLRLTQLELDVERIKKGEVVVEESPFGFKLVPVSQRESAAPSNEETSQSLRQIATSNRLTEDAYKEVNIAFALLHAEAALENDPSAPPEMDLAADWFYRWRSCAGEVSATQLQDLLGRILAGEIKAPGTFSLRTLDFVRNLSADEARMIARLAPFVSSNAKLAWCFDDHLLEDYGFSNNDAIQLESLGILASLNHAGLGRKAVIESGNLTDIVYGEHVLQLRAGPSPSSFTLPGWSVTPVGAQVVSLCSSAPNFNYLNKLAHVFSLHGFDVALGRIVTNANGSTTVEEGTILYLAGGSEFVPP